MALTDNVLANDTDVDGDSLTALLTSGPSRGTASLQTDGTLNYTPAGDFFGTDSLTYRVSDGQATSGDATVTITVLPVNDAPQLLPDFASTTEGVAVEIDALANDLDPEGGSLTLTAVEQGADGSVLILANGHLEYTPNPGFVGSDTFSYTAEDQEGDGAQSVVTVTVEAGAILVAVDIKQCLRSATRFGRGCGRTGTAGHSSWASSARISSPSCGTLLITTSQTRS